MAPRLRLRHPSPLSPPRHHHGRSLSRNPNSHGPHLHAGRVSQDYIRTARAKGLSERTVVYRHALRNAMIPILTVLGLQFGALLAGAIVTETIFSWPA